MNLRVTAAARQVDGVLLRLCDCELRCELWDKDWNDDRTCHLFNILYYESYDISCSFRIRIYISPISLLVVTPRRTRERGGEGRGLQTARTRWSGAQCRRGQVTGCGSPARAGFDSTAAASLLPSCCARPAGPRAGQHTTRAAWHLHGTLLTDQDPV